MYFPDAKILKKSEKSNTKNKLISPTTNLLYKYKNEAKKLQNHTLYHKYVMRTTPCRGVNIPPEGDCPYAENSVPLHSEKIIHSFKLKGDKI